MTEQPRSGSSTTLAHIGNLACYCTMQGAKVTHPDAPVTLLLAHAIELYLKAFLRLRGVGIEEVRTTFGHDFKKLVDEASTRGLSLGKEEIDIAAVLTEKESIRRSRYIETGYYQQPGLAALYPAPAKVSTNLCQPHWGLMRSADPLALTGRNCDRGRQI